MNEYQGVAKLAKKCPCCGCNRILTDRPEFFYAHNLHTVTTECSFCGLQVTGHSKEGDYKEAYRDALTRWNRRVGR